jgi:hypothetical protein
MFGIAITSITAHAGVWVKTIDSVSYEVTENEQFVGLVVDNKTDQPLPIAPDDIKLNHATPCTLNDVRTGQLSSPGQIMTVQAHQKAAFILFSCTGNGKFASDARTGTTRVTVRNFNLQPGMAK